MDYEIITVWTQVAQVFATLVVGGAQCGLIWWGLKQMGQASDQRTRQLDQQDEALHQQGQVLAELLRRTA